MWLRWLLLIGFLFLIELYAFQALKVMSRLRWVHGVYWLVSIAFLAYIFYNFSQFDRMEGQTRQSLFTMGLLLSIYLPKMLLATIMLGEDLFRVVWGSVRYVMTPQPVGFLPQRQKFISVFALGLAAVPFLSLIYGMAKGKYDFKVMRETIYFTDLPAAFDGMKLTQISDIHSGSFDDPEAIARAIDLINAQDSDLIVFTGDIVNTHAREMDPWVEVFARIRPHELGNYAVLGNHDYGEYVPWPSLEAKKANFEAIKGLHERIGFQLLLNEQVKLVREGESIAVVGVENWGHNFKKAGDINKAAAGLTANDFKILLSHDPSHWDKEVRTHPLHFQLTLSGHTHGLQFGMEIPGWIKWSPVQYVYKYWAGLYEEANRYLYVNRGFGFHAYPGRVGIKPEITVLELKKAPKPL